MICKVKVYFIDLNVNVTIFSVIGIIFLYVSYLNSTNINMKESINLIYFLLKSQKFG
jgi:hypothetical protein